MGYGLRTTDEPPPISFQKTEDNPQRSQCGVIRKIPHRLGRFSREEREFKESLSL